MYERLPITPMPVIWKSLLANLKFLVIFVNLHRPAETESVVMGCQWLDKFFQKRCLAMVVTLRYPYDITSGKFHAFLPLPERGAGVSIVIHHLRHLRVVPVPIYHLATVVGRAVIEDDDLDILVGLPQHAPHALVEEACVVVVGDNDGD